MRPSRNLGLHHLALRVHNVAAIRAFYVDLLGFDIEREIPDEELWLTTGTDSFVFLRGDVRKSSAALDHLGFLVPRAEDLVAWEAYLRAHHVRIVEPADQYDDGSAGLICRDPAGYAVQVLWHPHASTALSRIGVRH